MSHLIIANWKMNFSLKEAEEFCLKLSKNNYKNHYLICSPIPYLAYLAHKFPSINFCAQNVSSFDNNGAFTGEFSAAMLKSCKINYALIGHSERKSFASETNELIIKKILNCLNSNIIPIICIGESLKIRQQGDYKKILLQQLSSFLLGNKKENDKIIIAYEPIWAIGTNNLPSAEELIEIFHLIKNFLKETTIAKNICLVYGGSVNLENIEKILSFENINGALIGKASLDYQTINEILQRSY